MTGTGEVHAEPLRQRCVAEDQDRVGPLETGKHIDVVHVRTIGVRDAAHPSQTNASVWLGWTLGPFIGRHSSLIRPRNLATRPQPWI